MLNQTFFHLFGKTIRHFYKIHLGPVVKIPSGGGGGGGGGSHVARARARPPAKAKNQTVQQVGSHLKENVKLSDFCMETNFKSILFELLAIKTFYQAFLLNM